MSGKMLPPSSNTGVENTQKKSSRALVDWVSWTLPPLTDNYDYKNLSDVLNLLGLDLEDFTKHNWGHEGYSRHYEFANIKVYQGFGSEFDYPYWFVFSGQACRFYESLDLLTWQDLIKKMKDLGAKFKRIDLAIDDFDKMLDLSKIQWCVDNGAINSLFHDCRPVKKVSLKDSTIKGHTIYFGSPQSDLNFRIYDKLLERQAQKKELESWVDHWLRIELQFNRIRADSIADFLILNDDVGKIIKSVLKKYLNFLVKSKDKNKSRWKVVSWWQKFLNDVEPLILTNDAPDATVEKALKWLDKQVAPSLAMLLKAVDGNIDLLHDLIKKGESKMTKKHLAMLKDFEKIKHKKTPELINPDVLSPYDYL